MKAIIVCMLVLLLVSCAPRVNRIDQAYREGRLTEYQYLQLKVMEKQAAEADTANVLRIINSGRR